MESTAWGIYRGYCLFAFMKKLIPGNYTSNQALERWILTFARPFVSQENEHAVQTIAENV